MLLAAVSYFGRIASYSQVTVVPLAGTEVLNVLHTSRPADRTEHPSALDAAAFNDLYQTHAGAVWNYMRYRLGPDDAEDLTADVFTRAWVARSTYRSDRGSAGAWLWAIARNATTDALRRRSRQPDPIPAEDDDRAWNADDEPAGADIGATLTALILLNDTDRDLVALRFGAGHTNRDIAILTGLSEANVAQRLHRALGVLRRSLAAEG
jgi:RNA polymerase sigma-70 factor, ECF subfamily